MRRLPFYTVVMLATLILAWNFSFYREFYQAQAAGSPPPRPTGQRRGATVEETPVGLTSPGVADGTRGVAAPGDGGEELAGPVREPATGSTPGAAGPPDGPLDPPAPNGFEHVELRHPDGTLRAAGQLSGGLRVGIWTEYYEGGRQPLSKGSYLSDLRQGHWIYWYPNGQKNHEGDYEAGRREDIWRSYHENGELKREGRFLHGEREGLWTQYYSNGQVMETGHYTSGLREKYWQFFDYEGRTDRRTGWYESGRRVRD